MKDRKTTYQRTTYQRTRYNRYKLYKLFTALVLCFLLSSCGTVKTTNVEAIVPDNTGTNSSFTNGHDDSHDYRHLIAKANIADLQINQNNTSAKTLKPQAGDNVQFQPALRPLFTGSTSVGMKLLIISAEGGDADPNLAGITYFAKEIGVPYDVLIAKDTPLTTSSFIDASGDGKYQGIILSDKSLVFNNSGVFESAFTDTEWNLLWEYMRAFGVRQVAMSGFPGASPEDYGLRTIDGLETADTVIAKLTNQGSSIFTSLKADADIPITGSFTYQAESCITTTCTAVTAITTPILTHATTGNTLAAISKTDDGREIMTFTMNHNSFLRHTGLLAYDIINWVTNGLFIGERRMYYTLDIDDHYLESAVWNPATNSVFPTEGEGSLTYQISATDLYAARDGVLDLRNRFNSPNFNYVQVFNADKADPNATVNCSNNATLSEATLCVNEFFPWVSHTFTHAEMDFLSYADSLTEFESNINFAEPRLNFDRQFLVTGKHSGLGWYAIADAPAGATCVVDQVVGDPFCQFGLEASNAEMLRAAEDLGIKYLAANRGWDTHVAECDTCLITHPLNSNIKLIPRWPTNIFFNTTTPEENTSEFNFIYGPGSLAFFDTNLTWDQILDFEADIGLRHILSTSPYPHFIHQANLREYSPGRSLAYDLSEAIIQEYSQYFSLPLVSQTWAEMTSTLEKRTSFFNAGASGKIDKLTKTMTVTSSNGGTVYVTGVNAPNTTTFTYGNTVSELDLSPNQSVTIDNVSIPDIDGSLVVYAYDLGLNTSPLEAGYTRLTADGLPGVSFSGTGRISGFDTTNIDSDLHHDFIAGKTSGTFNHILENGTYQVTLSFSANNVKNGLNVVSEGVTIADAISYGGTEVTTVTAIIPVTDGELNIDLSFSVGVTLWWNLTEIVITPVYAYDLGSNNSPVEAGYTRLTPSGLTGVSFSSATVISAVNRTGTDLNRDFIGSRGSGTFNHVLENGTYQVTITIGEANPKDTVTIAAEGVTMADAISILGGEIKTISAIIPVTDGALNIDFAAGTRWWTPTSIVITPIPTTATGPNLLTNSDFEDGLNNWESCSTGNFLPITNAANVAQGTGSMKLFVEACVYQTIAATPGTTYTLTCQAKNTDSVNNFVSMSLSFNNSAYAQVGAVTEEIIDASYTTKSISLVAPNNSIEVGATFYSSANAAFIDDCTLTSN